MPYMSYYVALFSGVSCRLHPENGSFRFVTERGLFSYSPNISALARQRSISSLHSRRESSVYGIQSDYSRRHSTVHGLQGNMVNPWSTRYPSLTRPRHSAGVYVLGMYSIRYPSLSRPRHSAGVYVLGMYSTSYPSLTRPRHSTGAYVLDMYSTPY